jgi:hypothetical protein
MPKYPYYILPGRGRPVYKPIIKATLNYRKTHKVTVPISALIDSGADVCFCLTDIGDWLGIQFKGKKGPEVFTAANGSQFRAWQENVTLFACGKNYNCFFFFTEVLPRETPIILGQFGFFDHFKITFDIKKKEIEIN